VRRGVLAPTDMPVDFTLTIYDQALNATTVRSSITDPTDGFTQVGVVGPGAIVPGGLITVQVFEASSLVPIPNATVYTHQESGGVVTAVPSGSATTDLLGIAVVPAAAAGETILTVDRTGFGLFTFDGLTASRIGVPLSPNVPPQAEADGLVVAADEEIAQALNSAQVEHAVADSRHVDAVGPLELVDPCNTDLAPFECPFGPIPIRALRIGAESVVASRLLATQAQYVAETFLKAAEISLPVPPVPTGSDGDNALSIPALLDDLSLTAEELPIDVPAHVLSTASCRAARRAGRHRRSDLARHPRAGRRRARHRLRRRRSTPSTCAPPTRARPTGSRTRRPTSSGSS
jgi:hypothetical protein